MLEEGKIMKKIFANLSPPAYIVTEFITLDFEINNTKASVFTDRLSLFLLYGSTNF
ncbi:hypothetical protein [Lacihabitans lacunae]|uniref:Uncharacterized protein n=1 Tax=Lacihabitans lacunae TaxID=1028214 RepID=A0ABV7Z0E1_9BACT